MWFAHPIGSMQLLDWLENCEDGRDLDCGNYVVWCGVRILNISQEMVNRGHKHCILHSETRKKETQIAALAKTAS
jgi:hypothetical protein